MTCEMNDLFLQALQIKQGDIVCLVGAGGKTSLMFQLAKEAKDVGMKVLVTTSTRIFIPEANQYNAIDLSGRGFSSAQIDGAGIYLAGIPAPEPEKICGLSNVQIGACKGRFDLILIEADGSARKPLKGWKDTEPVIYPQATKTIGVLDIQAIGQAMTPELIHRLDIFLELVGARAGDQVALNHLEAMVMHGKGLFAKAQGNNQLFINKVETSSHQSDAQCLQQRLKGIHVVAGSIRQGIIHE